MQTKKATAIIQAVLLTMPIVYSTALLPTTAHANSPEAIRKCEIVIDRAKAALEQRGQMQVAKINIRQLANLYSDYPKNSPLELTIGLTGRNVARTFSQSATLMTNVATEVIQECPSIGLVRFAQHRTDFNISIGRIGNQIKPFPCQAANNSNLKWGYQYCL